MNADLASLRNATSSFLSQPQVLQESVTVARPAADVYLYLRDFSTIEQWDPGVYRSEKLTPGVPRVGTKFKVVLNLPVGRDEMTYELLELEPNKKLVLRGVGNGFSALDTIELRAPSKHQTEICYTAELHFEGWRALTAPAMRPLLTLIGRKAVNGMATALQPHIPDRWYAEANLKERLVLPAARDFTEAGYLAMPNKGLSERMDGKTVVVTGPTSGLGLATACECARLGARVVLVGRDADRLEGARQHVIDFSGALAGQVAIYAADLSLMAEAKRVADELIAGEPQIDVLVNNAGALFGERAETAEGHERSLAINLLAPWILTRRLMPTLEASKGTVINVASGGMYLQALRLNDMQYKRGRYDGSKAYARAKRALVSLSRSLSRAHPSVRIHSMHPGWAATPGVAKALPAFNRALDKQLRDARMGADTIVWLASSQAARQSTGQFWFDREVRPTEVLPGTAVGAKDAEALLNWLEGTTGV